MQLSPEKEDAEHNATLSTRNEQGEYVNPEFAAEVAAEVAETRQREAHNARSLDKTLPEWVLSKEVIRSRADKNIEDLQGCTDTTGDIEDLMEAVMTALMTEAAEKQLRVVGSGHKVGYKGFVERMEGKHDASGKSHG